MNIDQVAVKSLLSAASKGDLKRVDKLLKKLPVDSTDNQSQTALHFACANGHHDVVRHLIKKGAPLECENWSGWMPIMYAACYGHTDVVNLLVQSKARVNVANHRSVTPLTCAACFGHMSVMEILLENGADINARLDTPLYVTPLMAASQHGYTKIVDLILQHQVNVDYCNPDTGYNALMIASANGHVKIVKLLIEKGGANPNSVNVADQTAYSLSIIKKKKDVRSYLKDRTQKRILKFPSAEPTLIDAAKSGNLDLMQKLLQKKKTDINMLDEKGASPLIYACVNGQMEMVRLLLDSGAETDIQDDTYGWTALMQATISRRVEVVKLLLKSGADIKIKNNDDLTVFDLATRVGIPEITRLLAPNASGNQVHMESSEKKSKGNKQNWISKVGDKIGLKQRNMTFSRVPVQIGDMVSQEEDEELKKTSSVLSVFDANKALNGTAKARITLLSPQVILPDDVVAPVVPPFSKLPGFDLPTIPIVSTKLSNNNGSNTECSPKNSSDDTILRDILPNMGKKKSRSLKRAQQENNNVAAPPKNAEPDSPQSSMTSSGFTSISQCVGPAVMPNQFKKEEIYPYLNQQVEFQKPVTAAWIPNHNKDMSAFNKSPQLHQMINGYKKKSELCLPEINDLSIKSISSSMDKRETIESLLRRLSLESYHTNFEEQEVDIDTLKEMDDKELKMIGIDKTINRDRILSAVGKKKRSSKSRSVHDIPMNNAYQALFVPGRPGSTALSAPVDIKLSSLNKYASLSKDRLSVS